MVATMPIITAMIAGTMLVVGIISCVAGRRSPGNAVGFRQSLGIGLISSGFVATAILFLQLLVNEAQQEEAEDLREAQEAEAEALREAQEAEADVLREENFRLAVSLTSNLTGFDPAEHEYSLDGLRFSGKILDSAHFDDYNLAEFDFQDTKLRAANLRRADLSGANLLGADLSYAELEGADLSGANLRSATFTQAAIEKVVSWRGAEVNARTCWPEGFLATIAPDAGLKSDSGSLGHTCPEG
jgi:Pentapeptide repeats (8 copies)